MVESGGMLQVEAQRGIVDQQQPVGRGHRTPLGQATPLDVVGCLETQAAGVQVVNVHAVFPAELGHRLMDAVDQLVGPGAATVVGGEHLYSIARRLDVGLRLGNRPCEPGQQQPERSAAHQATTSRSRPLSLAW